MCNFIYSTYTAWSIKSDSKEVGKEGGGEGTERREGRLDRAERGEKGEKRRDGDRKVGSYGYLRRAAVQVVVHELVHEAEPAQARAVLALRRQRAQQRQALLGARQRAAVARAAAVCAPCARVAYHCRYCHRSILPNLSYIRKHGVKQRCDFSNSHFY